MTYRVEVTASDSDDTRSAWRVGVHFVDADNAKLAAEAAEHREAQWYDGHDLPCFILRIVVREENTPTVVFRWEV